MILALRTDKQEAEIGLYKDDVRVDYVVWQAHRELAETIHLKIKDLLARQGIEITDLKGIVVFKGPGSFTGLRIGVSVANALAEGLGVPIVGTDQDSWIRIGLAQLKSGHNDLQVVPEYGGEVFTTKPKK